MDSVMKRCWQIQLVSLGIAIAISVPLSFLLPFPYDIISIVGVFLGINYFIRQRQMRELGLSAWNPFGVSNISKKAYYSCMACGTKA
jgi:hypothetical protein